MVARLANTVLTTPQILLNGDALYNILTLFTPKWGIFDQNGFPLLVGDSVIAFTFTVDNKVSDFPIEQGQFASYNKVALPYEGKVTFGIDGNLAERSVFLQTISALAASLQLVNVVTPEITYMNANVVKPQYDRSRANGGASLIYIDVYYRQIRLTAPSKFSNTQSPDSQNPVAKGTVQPTDEAPPPSPPSPTPNDVGGMGKDTGAASDGVSLRLNTTPDPVMPTNGVTPTTLANSTVAAPNVAAGNTVLDPQIPNVPAASVTVTSMDGGRRTLTTYNNVPPSDLSINTASNGDIAAYKQADGTYKVEVFSTSNLPGQNNQTIPPTSPNGKVAS